MQLSYSKLRAFDECPLKYRYAYIERLPRPPIAALAFQRRMHAALARYHFHAKPGAPMRLDDLMAAYDEIWGVREDGALRETASYREGEQILRSYHARELNSGRVTAFVERPIRTEFGPWVLLGTLDRVDFLPDDGYSLVDYKLDRGLPEHNEAEVSRQLGFYALLLYHGTGACPEELRLYYLRHGVEQSSTCTRLRMVETVSWVGEVADRIQRERRWRPCEGGACRSCAFWKACPAKTGQERPLAPVWQQPSLPLPTVTRAIPPMPPRSPVYQQMSLELD